MNKRRMKKKKEMEQEEKVKGVEKNESKVNGDLKK